MIVLEYIIFPGLLFTLVLAFIVSWIDRKVSALVQWRVGPPLLQSMYDFFKLLHKETIVPQGASLSVFLLSPVASFTSLILVSIILIRTNLSGVSFVGDLFVIIYLLLIPSFAVIMGGAASANPLASLGASREMKMVLSYELPFIITVSSVLVKTGGQIGLAGIINYQTLTAPLIMSPSGVIAFLVALICFQSKMAQVPFDIPEAEQEIMGGAYIEYSGPPLALFVASRWILMTVLPLLMVMLFMGGIKAPVDLLKYVLVLVLVILIKNTNPRLRINQTLRFFWCHVTWLAAVGLVLSVVGL